jgi:hypothetical protein
MVIKLLQSTLDWQDNNYESSTTTTLKIPFQHFTNFVSKISRMLAWLCVCVSNFEPHHACFCVVSLLIARIKIETRQTKEFQDLSELGPCILKCMNFNFFFL